MSDNKAMARIWWPGLLRVLLVVIVAIIALAVLIFLLKQAQIHLTDGGQGSSSGGDASKAAPAVLLP
ncbi:hypothetical protein [Nocardioides sp.]|uniref:hypothetical protein n=1 Tax=Nocardioides sp. TaxID=35761 RepID=UPI002ED85DD8